MGKSIHPMYGLETGSRLGGPLPALIGTDESPAGYSLAGCAPAEPGLRFTGQAQNALQ
jgi:hypothetical protein